MTHPFEAFAGALLIGVLLRDAFETMILPRRLNARFRLTRLYFRTLWPFWRWMARRTGSLSRREYLLSLFGPLSMLLLFLLWGAGLITGFGMIFQGMGSPVALPASAHNLGANVFTSGMTFFTVGVDLEPRTGWARTLAVAEGGLGLGFIAVIISYLPVLYTGFSNRESSISMLDAHAGSPPTAGELLGRSAGSMAELREYLRKWEIWAAQLLESQISYPVLAFFRSQHLNQSWVAALATLLDSCALLMAAAEGECDCQARMTFAMARHAVVDLAQTFVRDLPQEIPDRLPPDALEKLRARLEAAGLRLNLDHAAVERLRLLREMYEPELFAMGRQLLFELPPWTASASARDNWQRSRWHGERRSRLGSRRDSHF